MKQLVTILVFVFLMVVVFAGLIGTREAVPDNAKFAVDIRQHIIVPAPVSGQYIFYEVPGHEDGLWDRTVSWSDLKDETGQYVDFQLPDTPEWNNFELYGREISLLRSWITRPQSRWDSTGFWRY